MQKFETLTLCINDATGRPGGGVGGAPGGQKGDQEVVRGQVLPRGQGGVWLEIETALAQIAV